MRATSSQRLNLRPTSRSMPTSSKPQRWCSARDAVTGRLDAGEDEVEPAALGDVEQLGEQQGADARAADGRAGRRSSPRRSCGRRPVPCRATARRSRRPRRRRRRSCRRGSGHDRGERAGSGGDPLLLLVERPRHQVERRRGVHHLVVVDRPDRFGIAGPGRSDDHAAEPRSLETRGRPGKRRPDGAMEQSCRRRVLVPRVRRVSVQVRRVTASSRGQGGRYTVRWHAACPRVIALLAQ